MATWYEKGIFYHMYPLGMTGAPYENYLMNGARPEVTNRFEILNNYIPHIKKLGCNAVYIGPLFDSSTHGYDTRDYKSVDNRLGTNEDFKAFINMCHKSDIKVVVDGVFNHTGREFFAFKDLQKNRENSIYKDWYKGVNFGWNSPFGDSFGYEAWQGHFELPCLNLWNQDVKSYLFSVIKYWIDEFQIDGIRLDCANILDFNFMKEMRAVTKDWKTEFWLMGEVIHGEYNRWVNPEMLHSVTNYELHKGLYSGHNDHNYFEIAHTIRRLTNVANQLYTFVDNHDENRIISKLNIKEQVYPVYTLLFTLPGIPSVYYGSEFGMEGVRTKESDQALRPVIPAENLSSNWNQLSDYIAKLAHIHNSNCEFWGGEYKELLLTNRQYAFARMKDKSVSVIAVNNDENAADFSIPVPVNASKATNLFTQETIELSDSRIHTSLPPHSGAIFKINVI